MNIQETLASINTAIKRAGAPLREEVVEVYGEKNSYWFRRMPFIEADRLRLHAIGPDGKFDSDRHAGANARMVAATLCDSDSNPVAHYDVVSTWPAALVDALALAANKVNGMAVDTKAEVAKNSETPPDAV